MVELPALAPLLGVEFLPTPHRRLGSLGLPARLVATVLEVGKIVLATHTDEDDVCRDASWMPQGFEKGSGMEFYGVGIRRRSPGGL